MNKQTFLNELEQSLTPLSKEERDDILRDMEEYFREAAGRGKTEEEIVKSLGSPKMLSETIIAETKIKRIDTASTVGEKIAAVFSAFFAIVLLTPINLFIIFLPLLFATLVLVIVWPLLIVFSLSLPIIFITGVFYMFYAGFALLAVLSIIFFIIGWFAFIFALFIGMTQFTFLYFRGISRLFQWNIQFIKNRIKG